MSQPRAVVVPFGVPAEARGLGLGLAAVVHAFAQIDGSGVAIAQLHARRNEEPAGAAPSPVEAFVPPAAWKDIAARGDGPNGVELVLTGAFEPPVDGHGTIQLLAFGAADGQMRAQVEAPLDGAHAGASLVGAIEQLWSSLGGDIGSLGALRELEWDSLESVLRAERCALHDPLRRGPHDRLAAMLHFGRAIGDAPLARYPVERLAALAMDTASGAVLEPKLASAAARALERAVDDAPCHVELMEALAALQLHLGHPRDAERRLNAALAIAPKRTRLHALLAQALRAQSQFDAALASLRVASALGDDPNLAAERGLVLAARGDLEGAAVAWREALSKSPVHPTAFVRLGSLAVRAHDAVVVQSLVDAALVTLGAHPDVLRCAIQLALATESEGIARAARIARLCARVLEVVPDDVWTGLALAKSLLVLGDPSRAHARLVEIERIAPDSAPAAEAQLVRLAIRDAGAELELRAVARAARIASPDDLADVAVRARRLATSYGGWLGWFALAVAERRRGRAAAARRALHVALEVAPGATAVHIELTDVLISLGDSKRALEHARLALSLEGDTPRGLVALGRAHAAAGSTDEARDAATRALVLEADNGLAQELLDRLPGDRSARTWGQKLVASLLRRKK